MSKDQTVRIGIVGPGFARSTQIPGFLNCDGASLVAIASRRPEHAAEVAREFGIPHVASDWQELVERDDIDLVSVVTPPSTHLEITLAALEQGKSVLCEKPMAMNAGEARRMCDRAEEAGVLALIDHELRFLNSRMKMRAMLHDGAIGDVRHCHYVFRSDYRGVLDRAWDWWSDIDMGGGTLGAIGSHAVDSLRWLLGTEIDEVSCLLATHIAQRPDKSSGKMREVTTDDAVRLMFKFHDGTLTHDTTGSASLSVVDSGHYQNQVEIYGSNGALMVEETGAVWHSPAGSGDWRPVETEQNKLAPNMKDASWSRGFTSFARAIVDAMRAGQTAVEGAATFEDGYQIQLVLDAARASNEQQCWVAVDR